MSPSGLVELSQVVLHGLSKPVVESPFFFSSNKLVCTELVYRAYDRVIVFPEFPIVMSRRRLPANSFVQMWADDRGKPAEDRRLERIRFLDFDEANQRAILVEDEETLVETLSRSRFTFLR